MTKHSTLANADDLHYAKVRSFEGDPANILPEFIDQIIIATDTNRIYRATGTIQGAIVALEAGGGEGVVSFFPPETRPDKEGRFYFDQSQNQLYIAVANPEGDRWWKPSDGIDRVAGFSATCFMQDISQNAAISSSLFFTLFFSALSPSQIESSAYDFTRTIATSIQPLDTFDLKYWLDTLGQGCYTFGYTADNPDNELILLSLTTSNIPSGLELRDSSQPITALGVQIDSTYLYYSGLKVEGALEMIFSLSVFNPGL